MIPLVGNQPQLHAVHLPQFTLVGLVLFQTKDLSEIPYRPLDHRIVSESMTETEIMSVSENESVLHCVTEIHRLQDRAVTEILLPLLDPLLPTAMETTVFQGLHPLAPQDVVILPQPSHLQLAQQALLHKPLHTREEAILC